MELFLIFRIENQKYYLIDMKISLFIHDFDMKYSLLQFIYYWTAKSKKKNTVGRAMNYIQCEINHSNKLHLVRPSFGYDFSKNWHRIQVDETSYFTLEI